MKFKKIKYPLLIIISAVLILSGTVLLKVSPELGRSGLLSSLSMIGIFLYLYLFIDFLNKVNDNPQNKKVLLTVITLMFLFGTLLRSTEFYYFFSQRMWNSDAYAWMTSALTVVDSYHTSLITYGNGHYTPAFILPAVLHNISAISLYQIYYYIMYFLGYFASLISFLFILTITRSIRISAIAGEFVLVSAGGGLFAPSVLGGWMMFFVLFTYFKGLRTGDNRFMLIAYFSSIMLVLTHHLSALYLIFILSGMYLGARFVEILNEFLPKKYHLPDLKELKPSIAFIFLVGVLFGIYNTYTEILGYSLGQFNMYSINMRAAGIGLALIFLTYAVVRLRRVIVPTGYVTKLTPHLSRVIEALATKKGIVFLSAIALMMAMFPLFRPLSGQEKVLADVSAAYSPLTIEGRTDLGHLIMYTRKYLFPYIMAVIGIWVGLKKRYVFTPAVIGWGGIFYAVLILSNTVLQGAFLEPLRIIIAGKLPMQILAGIAYAYFLFESGKIVRLLILAVLISPVGFITTGYGQEGLYYDSVYAGNMWTISNTEKDDRIYTTLDVSSWMRYEYLLKYRDNDPARMNLVNYKRLGRMDPIIYAVDKDQAIKSSYDLNIRYVYLYPQDIWQRMNTLYTFRDKPSEVKKQVLSKFDEAPFNKIYTSGDVSGYILNV